MNTLAQTLETDWTEPVAAAAAERKIVAAVFPEYRPDLARNLAHRLGYAFHDFRREVMQGYGWEAGALPLEQLTLEIQEHSRQGGVVVFNVEALLAAKPDAERRAWLRTLAREPWPHPVVLCIVLFPQVVLETPGIATVELDRETLPQPTLLARLLR